MRWRSSSSVRPASGFIEPCISSRAKLAPVGPDWVHEIKHDGYRFMIRKDDERVRVYTCRGTYRGGITGMAHEALCTNLRKRLARLLRVAYGKDLGAILLARGHELWLIGIDSKNKRYIDICGNIDPAGFQAIVDHGFHNTDAGYQTSAHEKLNVSTKADAFLLNTDYFSLDQKTADPLIVHELSHLLEQVNEAPDVKANDEENAEAILKSLEKSVRKIHTKEWALNLAVGARVLLTKQLTPYSTIRSFLEAAIPSYDRDDGIKAKKGWRARLPIAETIATTR